MPSPLRALIGLLLCSLPIALAAQPASSAAHRTTPKNPKDILALISATHQLHSDGIKPWHLKASFQFFDGNGKPTDQGTLEEFFVSPDKDRLVITTPEFTQTRITNKDGDFTEGAPSSIPFFVRLAYDTLIQPTITAQDAAHSDLSKSTETAAQVKLTCITFDPLLKHHPLNKVPVGLFPTYCVDPDTAVLRAYLPFGGTTVTFNTPGSFLGNDISSDISIFSGGFRLLDLHVDTIQTMPQIDQSIFAPSDAAVPSIFKPTLVDPKIVEKNVINKVSPTYPESALKAHIDGPVIIRALITADGHIRDLRIIEAPTVEMAIVSLAAVRKRTYKPYLLSGKPAEVETTITVPFKFGN